MQITIKKYEHKEEEQLKQLLILCFEGEALLNIVNEAGLKFAYSAIFDNKLIGITFAWTNGLHPYCTYFRILCNPFYNSFNVEEKLLSKVVELNTENFSLQTSFWETSAKLNRLYRSNGFKEIRRTYMPSLKMSDVSDYIFSNREKYIIKTLKEILMNKSLTEELLYLVKGVYEETHAANPVAKLSIDKWREIILADDVVSKGSYIYLNRSKQNIIAYSFLHESEKKDSLELGWCGAVTTEYIQLIPQLVLHQINYAIKDDIQFIIGEFDTTDNYAKEVLYRFPFAPSPTWITYQTPNC